MQFVVVRGREENEDTVSENSKGRVWVERDGRDRKVGCPLGKNILSLYLYMNMIKFIKNNNIKNRKLIDKQTWLENEE